MCQKVYKVGCVFPMVIRSEFRMGQYRDNDHHEDALHFTFIPSKVFLGPRRSPLIHAMYFMRYHTINTILDHLLSKFNQFLILGAGTDTSFWRLNIAKKPEIKWFEIDFPENLEMKRNLMEKHYGVASNYIPGKIQNRMDRGCILD